MKYFTVTTAGYRQLTNQMIESSGVSNWEIHDNGSDTGDFRTESFNKLCRSKPRMIFDLLLQGHDVWSLDGDVIFFDPLHLIEVDPKADIQAQLDPDSGLCCGFAFYRATTATLRFFKYFLHLNASHRPELNEQLIFNEAIRNCIKQLKLPLQIKYFRHVYSYGLHRWYNDLPIELWDGQDFDIPEGVQAFHANYTIGIETKRRLIEYVKTVRP